MNKDLITQLKNILIFNLLILIYISSGKISATELNSHQISNEAPNETSNQTKVNLSLKEALTKVVSLYPEISEKDLDILYSKITESKILKEKLSISVDFSAGEDVSIGFEQNLISKDIEFALGSNTSIGTIATISLPLYDGGSLESKIKQSKLNTKQKEIEKDILKRNIIRFVYQTYWTIVGYKLQMNAIEESIKESLTARDIVASKLKSGISAPIELNRFQVDVLNQEQKLEEISIKYEESMQELLQLLQWNINIDKLSESTEIPKQLANIQSFSDFLDLAIAHNLELKQLESIKESYIQEKNIALSSLKPYVSFYAQGGIGFAPNLSTQMDFNSSEFLPYTSVKGGVSIKWNLFNQGKTTYEIKQKDLLLEKNSFQKHLLESKIKKQVITSYKQVKSLEKRYQSITKQLDLAKENSNIIKNLYNQGTSTILDLFDAYSSYRTALTQFANIKIQLILATYELQWLSGSDIISLLE